jgi:hypothetical protein
VMPLLTFETTSHLVELHRAPDWEWWRSGVVCLSTDDEGGDQYPRISG